MCWLRASSDEFRGRRPRPRSAAGEMPERNRRVHRRADGQRRLVEDHLVRVVARRRGRVFLGRAASQEDHGPGHALEHVREVFGAQAVSRRPRSAAPGEVP